MTPTVESVLMSGSAGAEMAGAEAGRAGEQYSAEVERWPGDRAGNDS